MKYAVSPWIIAICLTRTHAFRGPASWTTPPRGIYRTCSSGCLWTASSDVNNDNTPNITREEEYSATKSSKSEEDNNNTPFTYDGRMDPGSPDFRCGFVSILGAPNMGKSTVMNALLSQELCIATARPQTTRHAILGIVSDHATQVCLVDTPGVIEAPAYKLQEGMMEAVTGAFHDADVLMVVTDVFSTPIPSDELFAKVQRSSKPVVVVVNKIDLAMSVNPNSEASQEKLSLSPAQAVQVWRELLPNALVILPVTASQGASDPGVVALRHILTGGPDIPARLRDLGRPIPGMFREGETTLSDEYVRSTLLPISPPLYEDDVLTDRTERFVASEMIRAALFQTLKKELPYCCEVQITEFREPRSGEKAIVRISADVIVERDGQKVIVIGKNGEKIKTVGVLAREKIEEFLQSKIFLKLNVKVNKDWRKKEDMLKAYGYLH